MTDPAGVSRRAQEQMRGLERICRPDVRERFTKIVVEHVGIEPDKITDDATFESLGCDSLDGIELLFLAEEEFDLQLEDDLITEASTFGAAVAALERELGARS